MRLVNIFKSRLKECKCCGKRFKKKHLVKFGEDDWFCSEDCFTKFIVSMPLVDMIKYVDNDDKIRKGGTLEDE